jgi:hypothetical protein
VFAAAGGRSRLVGCGRERADRPALGFRCYPEGDRDIRRLAVERLLEIIGEAANSLSEDFRRQHPGLPWRDITGAL